MKKVWEDPKILVQQFEANEYVAACGESGKVYNFKCDAHAGTLYYYPRSDGNIDGKYEGTGRAQELGSYSPCSVTHSASSTDDFYDGYVEYREWGMFGVPQNMKIDVIVWRGPHNRNGHATTNLDMTTWETAKS